MSHLFKLVLFLTFFFPLSVFCKEPLNITYQVIMSDEVRKKEVINHLEKAIQENPLIRVKKQQAFSKIYIMANQDVNDNVNPSGWTFAVVHVHSSTPIRLALAMHEKGMTNDETITSYIASMVQEQGFLKYFNIAHSGDFKSKSVERIINSFVDDFSERVGAYGRS